MRLIDADALPRHGQRGGLVHWQDIENAPTVDAVPKTQCRDCQFSGKYTGIDLRKINATG